MPLTPIAHGHSDNVYVDEGAILAPVSCFQPNSPTSEYRVHIFLKGWERIGVEKLFRAEGDKVFRGVAVHFGCGGIGRDGVA